MAQNNANQKLNDLLVSKNFSPQALDNQGKPAANPQDATLFSFDYTADSGKDYGTVAILINDDVSVYFGDNLGKSMDPADKNDWFDFLYQVRQFAMRNVPGNFSTQDLNKLKYSLAGQAAIKEGLFESWSGTKNTSWNGRPTEARLMIKHKKTIGEGDARFRYVESLFVETADGERYKLPFTKLSGGRAMVEHVRQGGKPYDARGQHIGTIVQEMNVLSRFRRANQGRIFEGETAQLVEQATHYYETLQHTLKSLSSKTGYSKYFEAWDPAAISDEDVIIEDLRHMFVETNIDSRIEQALPLLAKLQRETAMKEANIFEDWANLITEGTWALPDTKEKQTQLIALLSQELPVGADATNATEQLYDLLGDDELFDQLADLASEDANADARNIIIARLEELKDNHDVAQVIGQLKVGEPTEQPVQPEQPEQSVQPEQPVAESAMSEVDILLQDIARGDVDIYNVYANPKSNIEKFVSDQIHEKYDEIVIDKGLHADDDVEQILQMIQDDLAKDYGVDEGWKGRTAGMVAGELLAPEIPGSGMVGGAIGDKLGDKLSNLFNKNKEEADEMNETTALTGQYGHSGKLKTVDAIDADMMDRIKFLAGITR
jgi:hypothetical protein